MIYLNPYRFILGGRTPSLDLQFANLKNLNNVATGASPVTFTRASSGTFVGADGLIQTATSNFALRSEEIETATWIRIGIASINSNDTIAPDGTTTADTLIETSGVSSVHNVRQEAVSVVAGLPYTASCYFRQPAGGRRYGYVVLGPSATYGGTGAGAFFDLTTGLITSTNNGTATIQSVGNGWFRLSITSTPTVTNANALFSIGFSLNQAAQTYTGDGRVAMTCWGAQLEQSTTVGEYIPTTSTINSAPRFDHNPTTGESLGLLVEEQRTNLLLRSEEFDNASWSKTNSSINANVTTSPDGLSTADKLVENTATGGHLCLHVVAGLANNTTYTFSVFCKADERSWVAPTITDKAGTLNRVWFNVSTGQQGTTNGTVSAFTATQFPNGWWRLAVSASSGTGASDVGVRVSLGAADNTAAYTGNGSSGAFVWGAQLEAGVFIASYIPTIAAAVTRSTDVASITGTNFSSWYNQTEGGLFTDTINRETYFGANMFPYVVQIDDGTNNNRLCFDNSVLSDGYRYNIACTSGGVSQGEFNQFGFASGSARWASAFKTNDFAFAINLSSVVSTKTTGTLPNVITQLRIGMGFGKQFSGTIRRLTYWNTRLPNAVLQQITT